MPDPSESSKSENEPSTGSPQLVFANLNRSGRPLLTEIGYRVFTGTTLFTWALLTFAVWVLRIEITLTRELMVSLAGSSVELSALSLAVLAILHELNKRDRWFKVGLLLVAMLFAGVVLGGFFLALTWQAAFGAPQPITIVIVAILGVFAIFQIDWQLALGWVRVRGSSRAGVTLEARSRIQKIRLGLPFVLPILLVWFPGINRLTSVVIVFGGALLALVVLMVVTTVALIRSREETEAEDPFITALRARQETETKALLRAGELKEIVRDELRNLQDERIKAAPYPPDDERATGPEMVDMKAIVERLRQIGVTDDKGVLANVVSSMVAAGTICQEGNAYWLVPDENDFKRSAEQLQKLAVVIAARSAGPDSGYDFTFAGLKFTKLRNWVAVQLPIPEFVAGEYIVPRLVRRLRNEEYFQIHTEKTCLIFVNKSYVPSHDKRERLAQQVRAAKSRTDYINHFTWLFMLGELPHTRDMVEVPDSDALSVLGSFLPAPSAL